MEVILKKQPLKYLAAVDANTRKKLYRALNGLSRLEGDIIRLNGKKNEYRLKIEQYRILFEYNKDIDKIIIVTTINTRTNIKY